MTLNQFIYLVSRPLGSLKLARFLSRNHPKILMYHRITDKPDGEGVSADQFRNHLKIIQKDFRPMTLRDLLTADEHGNVPKNAIVITFDDGYSDFADVAFPILKSEGVPATLFITAGFVNGDIWLWPDKIKYLVSVCSQEDLTRIGSLTQNTVVGVDKKKNWNSICDYCITLDNKKIENFINDMAVATGVQFPKEPPDIYKAVSWSKLREFVEFGLDIGNHSLTHPILTKLDEYELIEEINKSRELIKNNLSIDPSVFCYPNGKVSDFDDSVKSKLELLGYKYGVVAFPGENPLENRFEIRRYSADSSHSLFLKTVYGLKYISMVIKNKSPNLVNK